MLHFVSSSSNQQKEENLYFFRLGFLTWSTDIKDSIWRPTGGECPALRAPEEGAMVCSNGFKGGSLCKFSCERGYREENEKNNNSNNTLLCQILENPLKALFWCFELN